MVTHLVVSMLLLRFACPLPEHNEDKGLAGGMAEGPK